MKVEGVVKGQLVKILLDSGSTHNFVDARLLKRLGWQSQTTKPFEAMIADGGTLKSYGCFLNTPLTLGRYNCEINLFALPL